MARQDNKARGRAVRVLLWACLGGMNCAWAVTPLEHTRPAAVVTLDYLLESCTVVGETAHGMIPHFDCESYLYGVLDVVAREARGKSATGNVCLPPKLAPREVYRQLLGDLEQNPAAGGSRPAIDALIPTLRRHYPCGPGGG